MEKSSINLVLKVLGASLVLAIAIKYGAPYLAIPPTSAIALISVLLPSVILAGVLGREMKEERGRQKEG